MKQKLQKILAIFLFALLIYFIGHTLFWLVTSFMFLEWTIYIPMDESGDHRGLRFMVFVWTICSFAISLTLTK